MLESPAPVPTHDSPTVSTPKYYVGIGASAGGLEAIEDFFKNAPIDSGMAFIIVQHLWPIHKSMMVELLSHNTKMPVLRVEDTMLVEPNHVYLIPPNYNLKIFHGKLLLDQQEHDRGINLPIDIFFKSLAEDQEDKSIAIVLSGTGSDGARGIRTIKENMGMVMAQHIDSAKFDGMPKSAIATGMCDFILPVEDMPSQLMAFAEHPYASLSELSGTILSDEDGLTRIFYQLREKTGTDFTFYKPNTLLRRIERRLLVNGMDTLDEYVQFVEANNVEVMTLYHELLIGVTNFFRDHQAFDLLSDQYLPELLRKRNNGEFRIWVAGCSTGEEAYSLAILCCECIQKLELFINIKIFATDVDRNAIIKAGNGKFAESIAADVPHHLLAKYFFRQDENFHVIRKIREMVVFAQQNLIKDPPFTNMDLISCRNLLIYLHPVLQHKAMELFNFSLRPAGVLFLGASETIGEMGGYFETLHNKWKFYSSLGKKKMGALFSDPATLINHSIESRSGSSTLAMLARTPYTSYSSLRMQDNDHVIERLLQAITGDYLTLALVVNEQLDLQYVAGDADGFFKIPSGRVQNNVAKMSIKELSIPLSTGIQRAISKDEEVIYANISIYRDNLMVLYDMKVKPLVNKKSQLRLIGVFLRESCVLPEIPMYEKDDGKNNTYDASKASQQRITDLEHSLQFHKENLHATVEELETSNEELQATNEELMASNEELQSTNEELQSVNEELYTVNAEYQNKILELTEANNDLENFNASTQIATLFLDENLNVRKYTPMLMRIYNVIESDLGRPFSHLSHYLLDINPLALSEMVASSGKKIECEVVTKQGDSYLMRIQPYNIAANVYSGIVITFIDINAYYAGHIMLHAVLNAILDGIIIIDETGIIQQSNLAVEKILGYTCLDIIGKDIDVIIPSEDDDKQNASFITRYIHANDDQLINVDSKMKVLCHDGVIKYVHLSITEVKEETKKFFTVCLREY